MLSWWRTAHQLALLQLLIYGYDADEWPLEPAIEAFEVLANRVVDLGGRCEGVLRATVRLSILRYSLRVLWPHSDERQQYGHLLLVLNSLPEMVLVSHWRDSPAIWEILLSTAVLSSSIGLAAFWTKMTVWFQQSLQASGR